MAGRAYPRPRPFPLAWPAFAGASPRLGSLVMRLALPALCLGGFALRLHLLTAYPLREDEAMYSVWALHLWRVDPLALTVWPDKPPLYLWLLGGVFQLFGPSEAAARLLNIAGDTLTIGLVAAVARTLWGRRAGLFAAAAYALNPFAISFAPTAYTDPTLVLWGMLALYAAITRRAFWAGLFLAAAIVTKQQGLLYAPLILGIVFLNAKAQRGKGAEGGLVFNAEAQRCKETKAPVAGNRGQAASVASSQSPLANLLLGFALFFLPVLLWDAARWSVAPSPWDLSVRNYAPLVLLPPGEWGARAARWGRLAWYLAGSWWVIGEWMLGTGERGLATGGWRLGSGRRISNLQSPISLIAIWSLGFLVLHIVTSVQIWDRYLLPLAPVWALLLGWSLQHLTGAWRQSLHGRRDFSLRACQMLGMAAWLFLLPPALTAAQGGLPVGGDHGDYAGLNESIDWLRTHAPAGAVVYHRDVSWQLRFAFFAGSQGKPGVSNFDLRWFSNAVYLADNAAKTPDRRKFLVEPTWAVVDSAAQRLQQRGIGWQERLRAGNFTVYELTRPPALPCDWCACVGGTKRPIPG